MAIYESIVYAPVICNHNPIPVPAKDSHIFSTKNISVFAGKKNNSVFATKDSHIFSTKNISVFAGKK